MANKTMLRICHLLNQCDNCERKMPNRQTLKKEVLQSLCADCEHIEKLKQLRPLIDDNKPELIKRILAKGEDMTTNEIKFLLKHNVKKKDIQEALGMEEVYFREILSFLGLVRKKNAVSG